MKPVPCISTMLGTAINCGIADLEGAYENYLRHYDLFFYVPEYADQLRIFTNQLIEAGLTSVKDGELMLLDITVAQAYDRLKLVSIGINPNFLDTDAPTNFGHDPKIVEEIVQDFNRVFGDRDGN